MTIQFETISQPDANFIFRIRKDIADQIREDVPHIDWDQLGVYICQKAVERFDRKFCLKMQNSTEFEPEVFNISPYPFTLNAYLTGNEGKAVIYLGQAMGNLAVTISDIEIDLPNLQSSTSLNLPTTSP